jgi:hypothetical protein
MKESSNRPKDKKQLKTRFKKLKPTIDGLVVKKMKEVIHLDGSAGLRHTTHTASLVNKSLLLDFDEVS